MKAVSTHYMKKLATLGILITGTAMLFAQPSFLSHPNDRSSCDGASASFSITVSGATSYQWQEFVSSWVNLSNTGVYSGVAGTMLNISNVSGLNGRQYRCVATGTGSTPSNPATLTVISLPTPTVSGSANACAGSSTSFSTTYNLNRTYAWNVTGGTIISGGNSNAITVSWGNSGNGSVTASDSMNTYGCKGTSSVFNVNINPNPSPSVSGNSSVCSGAGATYSTSSNSGRTYTWMATGGTINSGQGSASVSVTWGSAGTGLLSVKDSIHATGCKTTSAAYTVNINTNPSPSITGFNSICEGTNQFYSTNSNFGRSYSWSVTGGTISSGQGTAGINITWGTAGNGSISLTETVTSSGCTAAATAFSVSINAIPTPAISGATAICANQGATYSTPNASGHSYRWSINGGTISNGQNSNAISVTWGAAGTGVLTVMDSVNASGCKTTTPLYTVTKNPNPSPVIMGKDSICSNSNWNYYTFAYNNHSYNWTVTGGTIVSGQGAANINVNWGGAGTGSIVVTETVSATGCVTTSSLFNTIINPNPAPSVSGPLSVCTGSRENYSTSFSSGRTYQWTITGGSISSQTAGTVAVNWGYGTSGSVKVKETINATGCFINTLTTNVTINRIPILKTFANQRICSGAATQDLTLENNLSSGTASYTWTKEYQSSKIPTALPSNSTALIASQVLTNTSTADFDTASVSYAIVPTQTYAGNSCVGTKSVFRITVDPKPPVPVLIDSASATQCGMAQGIRYTIQNDPAKKYVWKTEPVMLDIRAASSASAIININSTAASSYKVTVTSTNKSNCSESRFSMLNVNNASTVTENKGIKLIKGLNILVSQNAGMDSYTWGKDALNGQSSIIPNENLPEYVAGGSFDPTKNFYWVRVCKGSCCTKVYYNLPNYATSQQKLNDNYAQALQIYPNPSVTGETFVEVNLNETYILNLTDLNGKEIQNIAENLSGAQTFKLNGLTPGIYLVRLQSENTSKIVKLIVQ